MVSLWCTSTSKTLNILAGAEGLFCRSSVSVCFLPFITEEEEEWQRLHIALTPRTHSHTHVVTVLLSRRNLPSYTSASRWTLRDTRILFFFFCLAEFTHHFTTSTWGFVLLLARVEKLSPRREAIIWPIRPRKPWSETDSRISIPHHETSETPSMRSLGLWTALAKKYVIIF